MEQVILGILIGAVALGIVAVTGWLIYTLHEIYKAVKESIVALNRAAAVFEKSANVSSALAALAATNRQLLGSIGSLAGAFHAFSGVVLQQPGPDEPPEFPYPPTDYDLPRRPTSRPPVPPFTDQFATVDEAGVMTQDDADLASIEFQREAEARGEPTEEDILGAQKAEDVRESV